ncbi:hypothetical protein [Hymenobacter sp. 102]|uniref:hypothetical protein n=1 Tax=Hymenobacter sp. 102 TaxID=3403152 RepID=UPI003CED3038
MLALSCVSCGPQAPRTDATLHELLSVDFEQPGKWSATPPVLTTDDAHSGTHALYVEDSNPFSTSYRTPLSALFPKRPRAVLLDAWVKVPSLYNDARLVLTVANPSDLEHPYFSHITYLFPSLAGNRWHHIQEQVNLPYDHVHADHVLTLYAWAATAGEKVLIDDVRLLAYREDTGLTIPATK